MIDAAVNAAREAFESWSTTKLEDRASAACGFVEQLRQHRDELREIICEETDKPRWESATEVEAMINKVGISIEALRTRRADTATPAGATRYKPHGVVAVLGPFNFPGHLPNGHIV